MAGLHGLEIVIATASGSTTRSARAHGGAPADAGAGRCARRRPRVPDRGEGRLGGRPRARACRGTSAPRCWPRADATAAPWLRAGALRLLIGADVHEYLPAAGWNKGDAVRWIAHDVERRTGQAPWVAYFGDDLTDEDAFRAVGDGVSVVVGRRASAARYRLESPADVALALADLADVRRPEGVP